MKTDRNLRLRARHARPRQTLNSTPPHPLPLITLHHELPFLTLLLTNTPFPLPRRTRKDSSRRLARLRQSELGTSHVHLPMVSRYHPAELKEQYEVYVSALFL